LVNGDIVFADEARLKVSSAAMESVWGIVNVARDMGIRGGGNMVREGGTILETEAGESKCFPCSMDSLMNNLSRYPSSKTTVNPARTKTGYLRPVTCPRKVNAFQYAYTTINTAIPNLTRPT
jgi:hypothetical protein